MLSSLKKLFGNKELTLEPGRTYKNRDGEDVIIIARTDYFERAALMGYDFRDTRGRTYLKNGRFTQLKSDDRRDLIELVG